MKKTNLITTLALVVIVAIALSTATYAWYTSQSSAKASTTLYAATSTSASIAIDTTANANSANTSLTFTLNNDVTPMVPTTAPAAGTTTFTDMTAEKYFVGAPINAAGYFTAVGAKQTPATINKVTVADVDSAVTSFYVINTNPNTDATVAVKVTGNAEGYTLLKNKPADWASLNNKTDAVSTKYFSVANDVYTGLTMGNTTNVKWEANKYYVKNSELLAQLRVAVFQGTDGNLVGIWAGTNVVATNYYAGTEAWKTATDENPTTAAAQMTKFDAIASGVAATTQQLSIAAQTGTEIKVIAWFDGEGLVDSLNGLGTAFTIEFNVVNA